jgi:hypothetical protein
MDVESPNWPEVQLRALSTSHRGTMNRLFLLSLAIASIAACDVGDVPSTAKPDGGNNIVCEQPVDNAEGHHMEGLGCLNSGCHKTGEAPDTPDFMVGGTVYETAAGAPKGTATVIISWTGGSAKLFTSTGAAGAGPGNFHGVAGDLTGITYPATVKVSLCPEPEKAMVTPLANADDLNCSRAGCHGSVTPKVFWKQ